MNALQLGNINVVIAGSGGIGAAMVQHLLASYPVEKLFWLHRSEPADCNDPRVIKLFCDATAPASIVAATEAISQGCEQLHVVINTVGMLHAQGITPEKRLRDVSLEAMLELATVNAFFLPQLAAGLAPLLRHPQASILASLSARVGSITDNGMGGWYSYRASKAAHNMLLKTLAREWRVSHKLCSVVALHPGTVDTALSQPYTPANYRKRVLTPPECAEALLGVLGGLTTEQSGSFFSWEGEELPW